ncbi:MAG: error-prone DNA polymerase [Rhodospirillaceae bacterium]|nr:error-prone DNA polymerase [Rhodospirillaceae bacterium]
MTGYAELQVTTNYSFLRGASYPRELVMQAADLGLSAIAVTDRNSLAGVVKAYAAATDHKKKTGQEIKFITGCRLDLACGRSLLCYPQNREAYSRLVRLLTLGKRRVEKGQCHLTYDDVATHGEGQIFIALADAALGDFPDESLRNFLTRLKGDFRHQTYLALTRRFRPNETPRLEALAELARDCRIPTVATNDVLFHKSDRRILQDVVTCIRLGKTIDTLGHDREWSADRFLKPPAEMARLFSRYPEAVEHTQAIAARCSFSLGELAYQYPDENLIPELTAQEALEKLTHEGAAERYPQGVPEKVKRQIAYEMAIIGKLKYAPYFLTVWRIVKQARKIGILCQGRGSAANSAVCYCLGVTPINPDEQKLLFERFISEDRGEPPDIDVDFEHERREEIIQWIYNTYGRDHAAMTATVIHYRSRRAVREVAKALALPEDIAAGLVAAIWGWSESGVGEDRARALGLDPNDWRLKLLIRLSKQLIGFPRHLSQHPGGFVISKDRLDDLVPIENASMEDRTVIEWDKDDIETLSMMKVDVLGLGMLGCLRRAFDLLRDHKGIHQTIAGIPRDDPALYDMLCKADSVGVFQVESRAQMNMLPRLKPRCYYDLVVEVAIVRPGPIQGGMVHPYLKRRQKIDPETYPSEELRAVLTRTMGVPLFQEQAMEIAIVAAKFTPSEADALRRAMATFRNDGRIHEFADRFIGGMTRNGYEKDFAERCFEQIKGFGTYGFPESHAASFAILVCASSWIKCHHPDVFLCAILNAQPMGFYQPAQLVRDAREHGVTVRPVDVNASRWDSVLELDPGNPKGYLAVRLGFRLITGMKEEPVAALVAARERPYVSPRDLWRRSGVAVTQVVHLAEGDAFASLGFGRRDAIWSVKALRDGSLPLFDAAPSGGPEFAEPEAVLRPLTLGGEVAEDYVHLALSLRAHPLSFLREKLRKHGWMSLDSLKNKKDGAYVNIAGLVLVRQRPGTATGVVFVTMEDEFTHANLVVWSTVFERYRSEVMTSRLLACSGKVQTEGNVVHVVVRELFDLSHWLKALAQDPEEMSVALPGAAAEMRLASRDFH